MTTDLLDAEFGSSLDEFLDREAVYWDEDRSAWYVTRYAEAQTVLKDDATFTRDDRFREGGLEFWRRGLAGMEGDTHRRTYFFHARQTSRSFAERITPSVIRPVAQSLIGPLVAAGRGDLAADYADPMPLLVGCRFMGFEIDDDDFRERIIALGRVRDRWKEALLTGPGCPLDSPVARAGSEAVDGLYELWLPTIRARREHPRDDLISALWAEGTRTFPDWGEDDMVASGWSDVFGGETKLLVRNLMYLLLTRPELRAQVASARELVPGLVEEGLRFMGPVRSLNKLVMQDVELGGQLLHAGDRVFVMLAAANRDPAIWESPRSFQVDRANASRLLSFGQGTRYCLGRFLARAEGVEAVNALLDADVDVELDSNGDPPAWAGAHTRSITPLHVTFAPRTLTER
ncbi:MAG: cytochrome [Acidimicrobiaceae bacterium]|nr:cytochrome [Acidimicrobiaceae bacterium]